MLHQIVMRQTKKADFWRVPNWYRTMTTDLTSDEWNITELLDPSAHASKPYAKDIVWEDKPHIGHVYVLYHKAAGNMVYVGSTIGGPEKRKAYHLNDAYTPSSKNYNSRLYQWVRECWEIRDDAEQELCIAWVRNVHLPQLSLSWAEKARLWQEMLRGYEKAFIETIPKHRLLNTNLTERRTRDASTQTEDLAGDRISEMLQKAMYETDQGRRLKLMRAAVALQELE